MPELKTNERIFETSTITGAGDYTLDGAQPGHQALSIIGAGNYAPVFVTDDVNWEALIATYIAAPNRAQRTHVKASSNGGAAVNWGANTLVKVRCGWPAWLAQPAILNKSVAGGAGDTALTADEQRRDVLVFTGALTGNRTVSVDVTPWDWIVFNNTTGAFSLTLKTTAGNGIAIAQGKRALLTCDGVNVVSSADNVPDTRTITTNNGITGGGNLTADRTLSLDITGLTAEAAVAVGDELPIRDVSAGTNDKATVENVIAGSAASQAEQEAGSALNRVVTPGRQHFHPSAAKCWANITYSAGVPTLAGSYNITGIADTAVGKCTVTIATDFSSAAWAAVGAVEGPPGVVYTLQAESITAGTVIWAAASAGTYADPIAFSFSGFGDQA